MRFLILIPTLKIRFNEDHPFSRHHIQLRPLFEEISRDSILSLGTTMHSTRFDRELTMPHHCKLRPPGSLHHNREEATIAVMSIPSKPIPIPRQEDDPNNDEMMTTTTTFREAAELYDAATWRMFDLITSARLRAASNFYCKVLVDDHHHHTTTAHEDHRAVASKSSQQQQQLDGTTRRDRVYSLPEPSSPAVSPRRSSLMEEMFPMDSL